MTPPTLELRWNVSIPVSYREHSTCRFGHLLECILHPGVHNRYSILKLTLYQRLTTMAGRLIPISTPPGAYPMEITNSSSSSSTLAVTRPEKKRGKGHSKSRRGCYDCKRRKIKVPYNAQISDSMVILIDHLTVSRDSAAVWKLCSIRLKMSLWAGSYCTFSKPSLHSECGSVL